MLSQLLIFLNVNRTIICHRLFNFWTFSGVCLRFQCQGRFPRPSIYMLLHLCAMRYRDSTVSATPSDLLAASMVAKPIKCVSLTSEFVCNDKTMLLELSIKLRHVCTDAQLHSLSNQWKSHATGETLYFQTALFFQFNVTLSF